MFIDLRQYSLIFVFAVFFTVLMTGCSHYELTLNERTLYDPTEFRRNLALPDEHLQNCVKQVLREQSVHNARQLRTLQCGPGDIKSLEGLEQFTALTQLGLAKNTLTDIHELPAFKQLTHLDLHGNAIKDASVLAKLENLVWVNLEQNPNLNCTSVDDLRRKKHLELLLPAHCNTKH